MSIERAEQLKAELTDKFVVVDRGEATLKRFANLTGRVKTVNMNCHALVEFDGPEDISWYDIDPAYLTVVDAPVKREKPAAEEKKDAAPAKKPAAKTGGKSPLELAREQAAGGGGKPAVSGGKKLSPLELARQQGAGAKPAGEAKPADTGGKKLSPLELARQQGAGGAKAESADEPAKEPETPKPASSGGKKLSPLEMARMQDAKKDS